MLIDARTLESDALQADLCIVGGGAVGITIARAFAGSRTEVVVIEGGGLQPDDRSRALYEGESSGQPYFRLEDSRCRLFGGSTWRWGARGAPMNPIDFRSRDWVPRSGWPVTLEELLPYYERAEALRGAYAPFPYDGRVFERLGVRAPALDESRVRYQAFQFGKSVLFGEVYRQELERAQNVRVLLHANAVNLQAGERADHLEHVDVRTLDGRALRVAAPRFVLACGGIENARLLLLSDGVAPGGLCNARDRVGRCFMEHPTVSGGGLETSDPHRLLEVFSPGLLEGRLVEVGLCPSDEVQERRECLNATAAPRPDVGPDGTQALRELVWDLSHARIREGFAHRVGRVLGDPAGVAWNAWRHVRGRPKRFRVASVSLELRIEQEPDPDSRVTLAATRDALGLRRAHLHWRLSERDRLTMQVLAEEAGRELERLGLGRLEPASWLAAREHVFGDDMVGGHHHMGTTRMSDDPAAGVVDRDCRAHAVDNLWIGGSSVFATSGCVNPTPTVLALALRLAEHLGAARPRSRAEVAAAV